MRKGAKKHGTKGEDHYRPYMAHGFTIDFDLKGSHSGDHNEYSSANSANELEKLVHLLRRVLEITSESMRELGKLQSFKVYTSINYESKSKDSSNKLLFGTFDCMRAEMEVLYSGE